MAKHAKSESGLGKIIHRLWLGPVEMPDAYVAYGKKWQELNPGAVIMEWRTVPDNLRNQDVVDDIRRRGGDSIEAAVQIADVVGYELVYEYGGIYVNADIEPVRSLDYMYNFYEIPEDAAFAGYEDVHSNRIVNSVLGSPKKHPFWAYVIAALPDRYWQDPQAEMVETTGPALLTDCVARWNVGRKLDVKVLPFNAFNQVHWSRIPAGENADERWADSPEIIGIHHWGHRRDGRSNYVGPQK